MPISHYTHMAFCMNFDFCIFCSKQCPGTQIQQTKNMQDLQGVSEQEFPEQFLICKSIGLQVKLNSILLNQNNNCTFTSYIYIDQLGGIFTIASSSLSVNTIAVSSSSNPGLLSKIPKSTLLTLLLLESQLLLQKPKFPWPLICLP